jgi:MFS family permease
MQTILVPLLGELPRLFHTSASNASWAVTSTLLVAAIATPISGRIGDMIGKRRVLLVCVALLTVGSIIVACTSQIGLVVLGRSLQGAASSILPLSIAILRDELEPERIPGAVALISGTLGVGSSLGLPVAAIVAQNTDWHVIFIGTAVLGALSFVAVYLVVPESAVRTPARFDFVGAAGIATGLLFVLLVVSKGNDWGWSSPRSVSLLVAGLVVLVVWARYEMGRRQPLVDIRVSAAPPVLLTNAASVLAGFAMLATGLVLPQFLQAPRATGYGLGQTMIHAGFCLAPSGVVQILLSPLSGRLVRRYGAKFVLALGLAVLTLGFVLALTTLSDVWQLIVVSIVNGIGVGLAFASMPVLIMSAVPPTESAAANGLNTLARATGASVSSAVIGVVLASMTMTVGGLTYPTHTAFRITLLIGAAGALAGLVLALLIPHPPGAESELPFSPAELTDSALADAAPTGSVPLAQLPVIDTR